MHLFKLIVFGVFCSVFSLESPNHVTRNARSIRRSMEHGRIDEPVLNATNKLNFRLHLLPKPKEKLNAPHRVAHHKGFFLPNINPLLHLNAALKTIPSPPARSTVPENHFVNTIKADKFDIKTDNERQEDPNTTTVFYEEPEDVGRTTDEMTPIGQIVHSEHEIKAPAEDTIAYHNSVAGDETTNSAFLPENANKPSDKNLHDKLPALIKPIDDINVNKTEVNSDQIRRIVPNTKSDNVVPFTPKSEVSSGNNKHETIKNGLGGDLSFRVPSNPILANRQEKEIKNMLLEPIKNDLRIQNSNPYVKLNQISDLMKNEKVYSVTMKQQNYTEVTERRDEEKPAGMLYYLNVPSPVPSPTLNSYNYDATYLNVPSPVPSTTLNSYNYDGARWYPNFEYPYQDQYFNRTAQASPEYSDPNSPKKASRIGQTSREYRDPNSPKKVSRTWSNTEIAIETTKDQTPKSPEYKTVSQASNRNCYYCNYYGGNTRAIWPSYSDYVYPTMYYSNNCYHQVLAV